jgi:hypothetical protein
MAIELSDIFNRFGDDYLSRHQAAMLPSHRRAIDDIRNCRTEILGGQLYVCNHCGKSVHAFHSCKNRHCPKCHTEQTKKWLGKRQNEMLPIHYFHLVVTIPDQLREIFRSNQKICYSLLMSAASQAILQLAKDPKHLGATLGILAVLHTWTQNLLYHPHLHCLITGGGLSEDQKTWVTTKSNLFLLPLKPLARLIRGKLMDLIRLKLPQVTIQKKVWDQDWVVNCTPWGQGKQAVLNYLARYAFRIAINNSRIIAMDDKTVTFRYKKRDTGQWKNCILDGEEFMRRFLQHVLPEGFHKIRYFGLWHPGNRKTLDQVRSTLLQTDTATEPVVDSSSAQEDTAATIPKISVCEGAPCQSCQDGILVLIETFRRRRRMPP